MWEKGVLGDDNLRSLLSYMGRILHFKEALNTTTSSDSLFEWTIHQHTNSQRMALKTTLVAVMIKVKTRRL